MGYKSHVIFDGFNKEYLLSIIFYWYTTTKTHIFAYNLINLKPLYL